MSQFLPGDVNASRAKIGCWVWARTLFFLLIIYLHLDSDSAGKTDSQWEINPDTLICSSAFESHSSTMTFYRSPESLYRDAASTQVSLYLDGKNCAMLRFLRPQKNSDERDKSCRRPPVDSAPKTPFIAGPLANMFYYNRRFLHLKI